MKLNRLSKGSVSASIQRKFAADVEACADAAFSRYLGDAGAAMHVPEAVKEAVHSFCRSYATANRLPGWQAEYIRGAEVSIRGVGNRSHPVCSLDLTITFPAS